MFTNIYSPLQKVPFGKLQNFWIKRDDLIDPFISGNKWRKLKYILKEAVSLGKSHLVTFGGAYSNHLVATAAAAARASLKSSAFVRGDIVENEMLMLCKLFGMELIFTNRIAYQDKNNLFNTQFGNDPEAFFIDEGGSGHQAVLGCAEIIAELPEDTEHLFCAAGTGATAAGLLQGIVQWNRNTILHVIPVLKAGDYIKAQINTLSNIENFSGRLRIHEDYHFGGYAKINDALIDFIQKFARSTGVLTDPVYTAKLFYAIENLSEQGGIDKEAKIIALHSGGLLGMFGMKDKFYPQL